MSSAYIKFARDNRHLYEVMMSCLVPTAAAGPVLAFARTWAKELAQRKGKTECQIASPF
jgi:hypothetical protein